MPSLNKTAYARALVQSLSPAELEALRNMAAGGSVRDLVKSLSGDIAGAAEIVNSMKLKLGAARDADAVRIAIYAGVCE